MNCLWVQGVHTYLRHRWTTRECPESFFLVFFNFWFIGLIIGSVCQSNHETIRMSNRYYLNFGELAKCCYAYYQLFVISNYCLLTVPAHKPTLFICSTSPECTYILSRLLPRAELHCCRYYIIFFRYHYNIIQMVFLFDYHTNIIPISETGNNLYRTYLCEFVAIALIVVNHATTRP